ncbi:MAG: hypothetical protein ABH896_01525 [Candidatus Jacksonbacteria bacterium]|nr:hypothetical protein [Patescibacteria group bacterium]MBU4482347.1 hypothetical protein [Patescibacteria group bacterium]
MKYFLYLIIIIIGVLITIKSEWMLRTFGRVGWFENKLGLYGGSRTFYKFLGIIIVFLTVMWITGLLQEIILSIFSPVGSLGR